VIAAVFAEYAGATRGLGILMQVAKNSFRTDLVLAAVAVTAGLTLALYALIFAVERVAIPWHYRVSPRREAGRAAGGAGRMARCRPHPEIPPART
jgi:ABC-type proline/glycine betaine transport system permease subunit